MAKGQLRSNKEVKKPKKDKAKPAVAVGGMGSKPLGAEKPKPGGK